MLNTCSVLFIYKNKYLLSSGYFTVLNGMIDLFLAGMETTSTSLMWTFLYMIHHPDIQSVGLILAVKSAGFEQQIKGPARLSFCHQCAVHKRKIS